MRHKPISKKLFTQNRKRIIDLMEPKALAAVNANDVLPTNADGTLMIHPNSDLFFLSGIEQEESVLLLFPDAVEASTGVRPNPPDRLVDLFLKEEKFVRLPNNMEAIKTFIQQTLKGQ